MPFKVIKRRTAARSVLLDKLDGCTGQACGFQRVLQDMCKCDIGMDGFRAAAQQRGIAGLEAKRSGIYRDIGAAFVNNADDAERHPRFRDLQAVRATPAGKHRADGVGERSYLPQPRLHFGDTLWRSASAVLLNAPSCRCLWHSLNRAHSHLGQRLGKRQARPPLLKARRSWHRFQTSQAFARRLLPRGPCLRLL